MVIMWQVLIMVAAVTGSQINDEEYYDMPALYHLDSWEECVARRGDYCLGTFELKLDGNHLSNVIEHYSVDKYQFNHTLIHRGLCLPTSCNHSHGSSPPARFYHCVNNHSLTNYGLEVRLQEIKYCKKADSGRKVDGWDLAFMCVWALVGVMNVVGTAYDMKREKEGKPIKQLLAWSVVVNWKRLTADHSDRDPRLSALKPVQGMKTLTLLLVMLAHSVLAYHLTYMYNPQFIEKSNRHILSIYMQNGTSIVQTFIMASSFLLAYNLLIHVADNPKKQFSLRMLPQCLMHRFSRISPLYLFILGIVTTWWAHAGDGPLWAPMIEDEVDRCRSKWWAQALFVNNFVQPNNVCLVHTWFLAVDMQLYIACTVLTLLLGRWPRAAIKVLAAMVLGSILVNFAVVYHWQLKPMVLIMVPELMRIMFAGQPSFTWLYSAPWDSLPSALIGVLVAFIYHKHRMDGYKPAQSEVMRVLYRLSVPCMFAWVLGGYWMKDVSHPVLVTLYAVIDRPAFTSLTAFAMYGFFNKIDSLWWKFLSWRIWEILGRMSLSIYLVHWLFSLTLLASRTNTNRTAILDVGGHWVSTIFLTYGTALPLHLFVELPGTRFLQSLIS